MTKTYARMTPTFRPGISHAGRMTVRWRIWGAAATAYVLVYLHRMAPAVIAQDLMQDLGIAAGSLGTLGAVYFYAYTAMQVPSGILADRIGPRLVIAVGMALTAVGSLLFAEAQYLVAAVAGRLLVGIGVSVVFVAIMKLQAEWFEVHEFGTLSGLTMLVGNIGAVLATNPLFWLANSIGWRLSYAIVGGLSLAVAVLCWTVIRDKPAPPGSGGSSNAGAPRDEPGVVSASAIERTDDNATDGGLGRDIVSVLGNRHVWAVLVAFFGVYGPLMAFSGMWGVPYLLQVYSLPAGAAAGYMMLIAIGIMVGSPLVGFISDKTRSRKIPYLVFMGGYVATWVSVVLWNGGRPPGYALGAMFFGLGFLGSCYILSWACAKEVCLPRLAGLASGTANVGGFLGAALVQSIMGLALDSRWSGRTAGGVRVYDAGAYRFALSFCAGTAIIGLISVMLLRETRCRNVCEMRGRDETGKIMRRSAEHAEETDRTG